MARRKVIDLHHNVAPHSRVGDRKLDAVVVTHSRPATHTHAGIQDRPVVKQNDKWSAAANDFGKPRDGDACQLKCVWKTSVQGRGKMFQGGGPLQLTQFAQVVRVGIRDLSNWVKFLNLGCK